MGGSSPPRPARPPARRLVLLVLGTVLLVSALLVQLFHEPSGARRRPSGSPNLALILVDTLRADHLGYHGHWRATSPRIDALAEESATFLHHYAHASRTGPSVATVFTGLHPRSHGVVNALDRWDAKGTLHDSQRTLAEVLREHGYECGGFVANLNVDGRFGFDQGFARYRYIRTESAPDVTREALAWLRGTTAPFFLYVHYMEPHSSYAAPAPFADLFTAPDYQGPVTGEHVQLDDVLAGRLRLTREDEVHLEALYDQEIRYLDAQVGELLDRLAEDGYLENTVVVFLADHGEEFFEHGGVLHGYTLYEEQLRVPLLIHDPPRVAPRQLRSRTRHVDLLPTVLELLGLPPVPNQGRSLLPLMRSGDGALPEAPLFAEASLRAVKTVRLRSFTLDGWKLIEWLLPRPREELFRLSADSGETLDRTSAASVAERMRRQMRAFQRSLPVGQGGVVELTEDEAARLRALGYLP